MFRARFPKANGRCNTEITVLSNQYLVDRSAEETETDSCNSSLSTGELEIGYWQGGYIIYGISSGYNQSRLHAHFHQKLHITRGECL